MKKEKIIDIENGDIIAVLTNGDQRQFFVNTLVKDLKNKKELIFCGGVDKWLYVPCVKVNMEYGYDLITMAEDYAKDYSTGIVDYLKHKFNTLETIEFVKALKTNKKLKNKTFVLIFALNPNDFKKSDRLNQNCFEDYKEVIEQNCNKVYTLYKKNHDFMCKKWIVEELKTGSKKYYIRSSYKECLLKQIPEEEFNKQNYKWD